MHYRNAVSGDELRRPEHVQSVRVGRLHNSSFPYALVAKLSAGGHHASPKGLASFHKLPALVHRLNELPHNVFCRRGPWRISPRVVGDHIHRAAKWPKILAELSGVLRCIIHAWNDDV